MHPDRSAVKIQGGGLPLSGRGLSLPWKCSVEEESTEELIVHLSRSTIISPFLVERWVTLRDGASALENKHRITNVGTEDADFLWGIHPGVAINTSSRIDIPESEVVIDESSPTDRLGSRGTVYQWPYARAKDGTGVDMRIVRGPDSKTVDMHYATKFKEGWLSVTDASRGTGIGLVFPASVFKSVWLWLVYGGWRGLYCAAVEAWTGHPGALDQAVRNGTHSSLSPAESLTCETKIVGYSGFKRVTRIRDDATVEGDAF